ncbi:unnamed protein product, partial [Gulo gulo]
MLWASAMRRIRDSELLLTHLYDELLSGLSSDVSFLRHPALTPRLGLVPGPHGPHTSWGGRASVCLPPPEDRDISCPSLQPCLMELIVWRLMDINQRSPL